jgi:hypothetical protein
MNPGRKKRNELFTKGEWNKFIDSILHPLSKKNKGLLVLDGFLHAAVEQNPTESVKKFIKYNLPKILEQKSEKNILSEVSSNQGDINYAYGSIDRSVSFNVASGISSRMTMA